MRHMISREASRRDPFGRIEGSGASLDALRRLYQSGRSDTASKSIQDDVGMDRRNNEDDVATVQLLLDRQKIYDVSKTDGPTGIFSVGLQEAIKTFQKEKGLKVDGYLKPEGETIKRLNATEGEEKKQENNKKESEREKAEIQHELNVLYSRLASINQELTELLESVNPALEEVKEAQNNLLRVRGKFVKDAAFSGKGKLGVANLAVTYAKMYPEVKDAEDELQKSREKLNSIQYNIEHLQKDKNEIINEIKLLKKEKQ